MLVTWFFTDKFKVMILQIKNKEVSNEIYHKIGDLLLLNIWHTTTNCINYTLAFCPFIPNNLPYFFSSSTRWRILSL